MIIALISFLLQLKFDVGEEKYADKCTKNEAKQEVNKLFISKTGQGCKLLAVYRCILVAYCAAAYIDGCNCFSHLHSSRIQGLICVFVVFNANGIRYWHVDTFPYKDLNSVFVLCMTDCQQ